MTQIRFARTMAAGTAALAALALGGCGMFGNKETPVAKDTSAPQKPAQQAAAPKGPEYDCGTAGRLEVVLNYQDRTAAVSLNGGAAKILKGLDDQEGYRDGAVSLALQGDGAIYTDGATKRTCKFVSRSLPAPAVAGVVRTVTAEDKGKTIEFRKGEKIAIALVGVPTAGYVWGADSAPSFVKVSDGPGGATSTSQWLPGFTGGNHWETVIVEATAAGEAELTLAQRRPWENKSEPGADTFKVRLKVAG